MSISSDPTCDSPKALDTRVEAPPAPTIINDEEELEVEEILKYRFYGRKQHQFLFAWKCYGREADECIPLSNLENCMDMISVFRQQHGLIFKKH